MSALSFSVSMISEPQRAGNQRVDAQRDNASCSLVNTGRRFCGLSNAGIVATPLFLVNVPTACERVGLSTEFSGAETDYHVEL